MRVLVACEVSGRVRDAFRKQGHDAWSCDINETWTDGPHIRADVRTVLSDGWDMMIAFPPCTYLAISGARHFDKPGRRELQEEALSLVRTLLRAPIPRIALENPVGVISSRIRKPDQIIQPWQFGHAESKKTCLWLKSLPRLRRTRYAEGPIVNRVHRMAPGPMRAIMRSVTYQGIADAMAEQWGKIPGGDE